MTSQNRRPTMKDNQAKYPQLRFKGYSDAWVQRKLGENATILTGGTPKTTEPSYWEPKEIPWMSSGEVNKKRLESTDNMISEIGLENSSARWVKEHSILIALAGQGKTRGMVAINNIPLTTNQSIAAIEPNESLDYEFVFQNLGNRYDELRMSSSGDGTRGGLNKKIISDILVSAPDIDEQKQIGKLFASLDNLIAANQRKLDLLKEQKKGYLQKLFPKNGSKFPQLRFAGFADAWEERKLGDITKISTGKLDANAMVENGKYDFYTSGIKKYRIDVAAFEGPSITIAGNGATVGYMHLADNKFNAYQRTYVLQEFLVDRSFIFSEIGNKLPKKIKQEARTGNIPYIVMDMLTELKLSIPQNNSEQQKIGSFFKQLDDTIDLHQRKLEKLQELKKGYLQKMFC